LGCQILPDGDEFTAYDLCQFKHFCGLRITHHLGQTFAIAQIDENHPAMVTATMRPAAQGNGFAKVCRI
jgi:hypothetical protein